MKFGSCLAAGLSMLVVLCCGVSADTHLNIQNNFGYTIVDVGKAMDIPALSDITGQGLNDWDQFNYRILGQLIIDKSDKLSWGPEIGLHRLYYWEEKYKPLSTSSQRWRSGAVWSFEAGAVMRYELGQNYYFLTGIALHNFLNDSGTTLGVPIALGHEIKMSRSFGVPLEFRMDIIFGNSTPIGIGGGIGLKFKVK
ncbi:MAG: hypothetical protein LHV68_02755 [Elusimicrobia bacterium]|nr:hypothetical protein [Candidatus Liberimonas magnetica]